jgi:hypothetical protein
MWKEAAVAHLELLSRHVREVTEETHNISQYIYWYSC